MSLEKFRSIFEGLKVAHGYFKLEKRGLTENPRKPEFFASLRHRSFGKDHLTGTGNGLGIVPINEENNCKWGCIRYRPVPLRP